MTLSVVRSDGRSTYDVPLRPLHEARGGHEIEVMRDDLVRILFDAVAKDVELVFGDAIRSVRQVEESIGVEFDSGPSRERDVVVGADGQHSSLRALVFGPERDYVRQLGAYLSIYTVDNPLGLRDQTMLYNEPGRGAAVLTARANSLARVVLLFRIGRIGIDPGRPPRPVPPAAPALQCNGLGAPATARCARRCLRLLLQTR